MKKILLVCILLFLFLVAGCYGNSVLDKEMKKGKDMIVEVTGQQLYSISTFYKTYDGRWFELNSEKKEFKQVTRDQYARRFYDISYFILDSGTLKLNGFLKTKDIFVCNNVKEFATIDKDTVGVLLNTDEAYIFRKKILENKKITFVGEKLYDNIQSICENPYLCLGKDGKIILVEKYLSKEYSKALTSLTNVKKIDQISERCYCILFNNGEIKTIGTPDVELGNLYFSALMGRKVDIFKHEFLDIKAMDVPQNANDFSCETSGIDFVYYPDGSIWMFGEDVAEGNMHFNKRLIGYLSQNIPEKKWMPRKTILNGKQVKNVKAFMQDVFVYNNDGSIITWNAKDPNPHKLTLEYLKAQVAK